MAEDQEHEERMDRLQALGLGAAQERKSSRGYSVFIRGLKIVLPLAALGLVLALFSWQQMDETVLPAPAPVEKSVRSVGKNELLNPKFESTDEKGNPYSVTAKRALQGQSVEDDMILLEEPVADVALEGGKWLAIKAAQSAFRQETQRLLLKGNVEIFHDDGYTLSTAEMDVDMKAGTARSDVSVHVQGPKGEIDAVGMSADREAGLLIFKGPAKLVLNEGM